MPRLLISVRSCQEARDVLEGGADLIDIKEPSYGSLGQADASTIAEIAAITGETRPVSAAMGELKNTSRIELPLNLRFAKWGLSDCGSNPNWSIELSEQAAAVRRSSPNCEPVAVAYADHHRAKAPAPAEVFARAAAIGCPVLLIDTFVKDGRHLLSWLSLADILELHDRCRLHRIQLALAGGISMELLPEVIALDPDWIAVRGAACRDGRNGTICPEKVRRIADLVHDGAVATVLSREDFVEPNPFASPSSSKEF